MFKLLLIQSAVVFLLAYLPAYSQTRAQIACDKPDAKATVPVFVQPGQPWILENLPCGREVLLLRTEGGWSQIRFSPGDRVGWIPSVFLWSQQGPPPATAAPPGPGMPAPGVPPPPMPPQRAERSFPFLEVFGGYSFLRAGFKYGDNVPAGWDVSMAANITKAIGFVGEFSGHYKSYGALSYSGHSFMGGVQFSSRGRSVKPFAHALVGGARISERFFGVSTGHITPLAMALGGGVDVNAGRWIAVRAFQLDYIPLYSSGDWEHSARLSAGVVFKVQ
jgi:hypothetical protein